MTDLKLIGHSSTEEWAVQSPDEYKILLADANRVCGIPDEVKDEACADPELVTSISRTNKQYQDRDFTVFAKLHIPDHPFWLARTFHTDIFEKCVKFAILDDTKLSEIIFEFDWNLEYFWSNFGFDRKGGCCPSSAKISFNCAVSACGRNAIIVGPAEGPLNPSLSDEACKPAAKILRSTKDAHQRMVWNIEDLDLDNQLSSMLRPDQTNSTWWPAQVLFDPRYDYSSRVTLICDSSQPFSPYYYHSTPGILLQYDLRTTKIFNILQEIKIMSNFVQYLYDGKQILAMEVSTQTDGQNRGKMLILDSDSLLKLYVVDCSSWTIMDKKTLRFRPGMLAAYSADLRFLAVVFHSCSERYRSHAFTFQLNSRFGFKVDSLSFNCRATILNNLKKSMNIDHLLLPAKLKFYLKGESC